MIAASSTDGLIVRSVAEVNAHPYGSRRMETIRTIIKALLPSPAAGIKGDDKPIAITTLAQCRTTAGYRAFHHIAFLTIT